MICLVQKLDAEVPIRQCVFPGYAPVIGPRLQRVEVPAGPLGLPAGNAARRVVHGLQVGVRETHQRLPQILEAVADVVGAGPVVGVLASGPLLRQGAVDRREKSDAEDILCGP